MTLEEMMKLKQSLAGLSPEQQRFAIARYLGIPSTSSYRDTQGNLPYQGMAGVYSDSLPWGLQNRMAPLAEKQNAAEEDVVPLKDMFDEEARRKKKYKAIGYL